MRSKGLELSASSMPFWPAALHGLPAQHHNNLQKAGTMEHSGKEGVWGWLKAPESVRPRMGPHAMRQH